MKQLLAYSSGRTDSKKVVAHPGTVYWGPLQRPQSAGYQLGTDFSEIRKWSHNHAGARRIELEGCGFEAQWRQSFSLMKSPLITTYDIFGPYTAF